MRKFFLTVTLALSSVVAHAAPDMSKDEQNWLQAINIFATDAKAMGMQLAVERIVNPGNDVSPVAAEYKGGVCTVRLAVRNNRMSMQVQTLVNGPSAEAVARVAAVAHEFGHCVHAQALDAGEALPPTHSAESEAMADVYALIWIKANAPSHYETALAFFRKLRADASSKYALSLQAIEKVAAMDTNNGKAVIMAASAIKAN